MSYIVRGSTLAAAFRDSFRERHPALRACSRHATGVASARLDQISVRSPIGRELWVLNDSILWQWPSRTDHDPVLADIPCALPEAWGSRANNGRPWRKLIQDMADKEKLKQLVQVVARKMAPMQESVLETTSVLNDIQVRLSGTDEHACTARGMFSSVFAPWEAPD